MASIKGVLASSKVDSCLVITIISFSFIFKALLKFLDSDTLIGVSFKSLTSLRASLSESALRMPFFFIPASFKAV